MTVFDRYVAYEMLQWLTIGTLVVLGVFFGTQEFNSVLDIMKETGMPLHTVLTVMALQLPTGLTFCMPGGVVLATMMVLTRQSQDCEIVALQLLGTPMRRILLPFLVIGLFSSVFTYAITENIAPQSRDMSRRLFSSELKRTVRPFPASSEVRFEGKSGDIERIIALGKAEGATVRGFVSYDISSPPLIKLICAERASWQNNIWTLYEGHLFDLFGKDLHAMQSRFAAMHLNDALRVNEMVDRSFKTTFDKTTKELKADIDMLENRHVVVPNYLYLQYYRRFAHPLSCFFLVLAASPLALFRKRRRSSFSLLYGGILIAAFFLLQQICLSLTSNNRMDPLCAALLPSLLLLFVGFCTTFVVRRA